MNFNIFQDIFAKFEEISNNYKRENQYFDILYDSISSIIIFKTPTSEDISINSKKAGIVARTFTGTWNEIGIQENEDLDIFQKKLPKVTKKGDLISEFEAWSMNKEIQPRIDPKLIPIEEKLEKVRSIFNFIQNFDTRILKTKVKYLETLMTRIFVNNEGSQLRQVLPHIRVYITPVAKEGRKTDFDHFTVGGMKGFEIFEEITDIKLEELAKNSIEMLDAEKAPNGNFPIILDPNMTGLVAHESFGHGLEADQIIRERSYLKDKKNQKVASDICAIYDTPSLENKSGSYFFDDEGIRAGKNALVENGILRNFIYDRRTASLLNALPQGNGRRENYVHTIHPRMSNTYFEPGDYEIDEMISEIKKGVILVEGYFGMEDPLGGGCQCTSRKGYLIENGEKVKLLKRIALSGQVLDLFQNIDAISKDDKNFYCGTCGKGYEDLVPVSSGGPYLRIKKALISPG